MNSGVDAHIVIAIGGTPPPRPMRGQFHVVSSRIRSADLREWISVECGSVDHARRCLCLMKSEFGRRSKYPLIRLRTCMRDSVAWFMKEPRV